MKKIVLNKNWKFKVSDVSEELEKFTKWMSCSVPGTVHTDLLDLGLIEDPFFEDNELKLQWISNCDWIYKTSFDLPDEFKSDSPVIIVFEGLDTIAEVWLNKEHIGNFNNMFRRYELDITSKIKDKNNELEIKFTSPIKYAKSLEEKHGKLYVEVNTERAYIRKAQYSFGWDWGPSFPTMGIYKPIYLLQKDKVSIKNLKFNTVEISKSKTIVEVDIEIENSIDPGTKLEVSLSLKDRMINEKGVMKISTSNKIRMEIDKPELWWPCCMGEQPLYKFTAKLLDINEKLIDFETRKVGIRTVELLLKENEKNVFKFLINNKEIFIRGVNWIPADSFLTR
ncbi:MAG: glycoside hydrolase family 2 protein, partial [Bacteroidetes bacterium]|nr:glycoside hydrolase family 2 protein [Bacteroidota bacterium]